MASQQATATETEAKFLIQDSSEVPTLLEFLQSRGFRVEEGDQVAIHDRYCDGVDWELYRGGWTYRWQDISGQRKLSLKSIAPSGPAGIRERTEAEQPVGKFPRDPAKIPEGHVAERVRALLPSGKVRELFRIHKRRRLYSAHRGDHLELELAIDQATITGPVVNGEALGEMRFREAELELKKGRAAELRELSQSIEQELGLLPARLSKFERGLQTCGLTPTRDAAGAKQDRLRPGAPVVSLVYACLSEQFGAVLHHEPGAWEGLDPEGVHQMRVATRKIREAFRLFRDFLPPRSLAALNREFRWLACALGNVRDLDVYLLDFEAYTAAISPREASHLSAYRAELAGQRDAARENLLRALRSKRYERLTSRFRGFLARGPSAAALRSGDTPTIRESARKLVRRRLRRVLRDGGRIGRDSPPEALHDLRIRCKRLRYAYEFFQPVYGKRLAKPIRAVKKLQDVLGTHQDACVASERLRTYADIVPSDKKTRRLLLALGQLISGQEQEAAAQRKRFRKVWPRFASKPVRKTLDQP